MQYCQWKTIHQCCQKEIVFLKGSLFELNFIVYSSLDLDHRYLDSRKFLVFLFCLFCSLCRFVVYFFCQCLLFFFNFFYFLIGIIRCVFVFFFTLRICDAFNFLYFFRGSLISLCCCCYCCLLLLLLWLLLQNVIF